MNDIQAIADMLDDIKDSVETGTLNADRLEQIEKHLGEIYSVLDAATEDDDEDDDSQV
jgi:hypothetical protein